MVPGSARLREVVMKGIYAVTLSFFLLGTAQADPINDAVRGLTTTFSKHIETNMWETRCARPEALRMYANCYVNPEGVPLWAMKGPERERWKPIAVKESVKLQKRYLREVEAAKVQGQRAAKEHTMNQQMCDFWKQQISNDRTTAKIQQYCKQ